MNSFNVAELKENTYFTKDVILDKTFLLLNNAIPISKSLIKALQDWDFKQIFSDGNLSIGATKTEISTVNFERETPKSAVSAAPQITAENGGDTEKNRLSVVQTVYNEYLNYIATIYTRFATHKELNMEEISSTVKEFCIFVKENRRYVLRIQPSLEAQNKNFLISHSMRSTVLAITIGLQMRLPLSKLIELGVSCILHEIGMIRLPPQLYMNDRSLSVNEKNSIFTHPVISYNILKSYGFPLSICLGALEHHEKENGNGYPRHLPGPKISTYAKIISVACSFEAITAPRHYKEASSSYDAMVEMLKNKGNMYDETVIKSLLLSLSLYPIGAYVFLSNGKIAQVTDVNPESPQNPIVQLLNEIEENGEPKTIHTSNTGVRVMRVLTKQEAIDIANTTNPEIPL